VAELVAGVIGLITGLVTAFAAQRLAARDAETANKLERGVEAALAIVGEMHAADLAYFSLWKGKRHNPPFGPWAEQEDLESTYMAIRRNAEAIPDAEVRRFARRLAAAVFWYRDAARLVGWPGEGDPMGIWKQLLLDGESVLGAYGRGDPVPHPKHLDAIEQSIDAYAEMVSKHLSEDVDGDAVAPPTS